MLDAVFSIAVWFFALSGFVAWLFAGLIISFYWMTRRQ
jgi:hypothetical protein